MARKWHLFLYQLQTLLKLRILNFKFMVLNPKSTRPKSSRILGGSQNPKFLKRWITYFLITCLSALVWGVGPKAIAKNVAPFISTKNPPSLSTVSAESRQSILPHLASGSFVPFLGERMRATKYAYTNETASNPPESLEQQARTLYEAGRFSEALQVLQQALQDYQEKGDTVGQAVVLSNQSLSYQQLGEWTKATGAMESAFALLQQAPKDTPDRLSVWAQALDVQGSLQLAQGKADKASDAWEQATDLYTQLGNSTRATLSRINQTQALQALGLYRQSSLTLKELRQALQSQPDSLAKAVNLRSLGEALLGIGKLDCDQNKLLPPNLDKNEGLQPSPDCARKVLEQSLNIATELRLPEAIASANLSLGNLAWTESKVARSRDKENEARSKADEALRFYQQAMAESIAPIQTQAQLNRLRLLVELERWQEAQALYPQVQQQIANLPPGRSQIYAQVNLASSLQRLLIGDRETGTLNPRSVQEIAQILALARSEAERLGDVRAQAQVLEALGQVYEKTQQWSFATTLTEQALNLSQSINASEISYQAAWQLGRVLKAQANNKKAMPQALRDASIAAYTQAYETLRSVRSDLVAVNPEVQFSFRERVEPVYRQLVDLLLQPSQGEAQPSQNNLQQAREVMEALQVAELENYLQEACQDSQDITLQLDKVVDQQDPTAAVIYPIILDDRLEVILKLSKQELYHYPPIRLSKEQQGKTLKDFQNNLRDEYRFNAVRQSGQVVYDWLIKPVSDRLQDSGIKTLVFILDGPLRGIPMSALYDGKQFLVQKYAVSLVLGLEVRDPVSLNHSNLKVLAASLTEPPKGFEQYVKLTNVNPEINEIQKAGVSVTFLRDQDFTRTAFNKTLNQDSFQVVHLATHGQFGADRNSTYILAADGKIGVDQLEELFGNRLVTQSQPVELLILSACKTAAGNERAVFGIAGTTVRAGARSAIAGLWSLADVSSVKFTQTLYQDLGQPGVSRSQALRQAQLALLNDSRYAHPRYWAPYVLVGSWL